MCSKIEKAKTVTAVRVILGFCRKVDEKWAFLGHYRGSSGNFLPNPHLLTPEYGIDRLSRNVGKKLPLPVA
jgi:hypothetical protein